MFDVRSLRQADVSLILAIVALSVSRSAPAQTYSKPLPKFEDYPIKEVFNQPPRAPILTTREQHRFRTRIREGVEKGWGVWSNGEWGKEQNKPGPNFAGHYIAIVWGCGAPCLMMVVCDARTGVVYNPPLSWTRGIALPLLVFPNSVAKNANLEFRRDSRLMVISATPHSDRPHAVPYTFYFLCQGNKWTLLRRVPIAMCNKQRLGAPARRPA
ncbi:MAG TPA: hypothetical protein VKV15_18960 [Bryobacteraceae bacterium]|nr:hypothetical protein [Bryobacteraceae bacterium]